ncbi:MAG: flagellar biosynthetic protein FliO [Desulfobacterales bacterium]|nr:MAG: flagellar biosynthetic protein FliO [Desulfobacterales bacterium]
MPRFKKKIVVFLASIAFCGTILVVCRAQSAPSETAKSSFKGQNPIFAADPNRLTAAPEKLETRELFLKMMVSVLIVVGLGIAAIYASKRLLPKITSAPGREIHVIETVHLGQRKSLHLLKIANHRILIASTNETITKLADLDDDFAAMDVPSHQVENLRI